MCEKLKSGAYARIGIHQRCIGQSASTGGLKDRGPTRIVGFAQKSENPRIKNEILFLGIQFSDIFRNTLVNNLVSQNNVFRMLII